MSALSLEHLDAMTRAIARAAACEPQCAKRALAWCLVNSLGRGTVEEALRRFECADHEGAAGSRDEEGTNYLSAMAQLCLVLCGEAPDETMGATRFHRHDCRPAWAHAEEPTALIGRFFFYGDAAEGESGDCGRAAVGAPLSSTRDIVPSKDEAKPGLRRRTEGRQCRKGQVTSRS